MRKSWLIILAVAFGCSQPVNIDHKVVIAPQDPVVVRPGPKIIVAPTVRPASPSVIVAPTVIVDHNHPGPSPPRPEHDGHKDKDDHHDRDKDGHHDKDDHPKKDSEPKKDLK